MKFACRQNSKQEVQICSQKVTIIPFLPKINPKRVLKIWHLT